MAQDSTEEVLCRFLLGGRKFYFKSLWGATHFEIQVSDGRHGWKGEGTHVGPSYSSLQLMHY